MTGKSSGIVRCHYGVSSLAAMATVGLEVFEKAEELFGHDIGFRQTGYVVGVGEPNVDSLRKSLAAQRAVGVQTEEIDAAEVARLWPFADLSPFAAFAWEARGGYGDAYQTAQAFAVSARAAGVRVRQGTAMTDLLLDGDRVTGVRLADGTEVAAGTVVVATGVWTRTCWRATESTCRSAWCGNRSSWSPPASNSGRCRCSPIWCRCSTSPEPDSSEGTPCCSATATCPTSQDADPDDYSNRASEDVRRPHDRPRRHPVSGLHRRRDHRQLRRLLRRHPGLEPGDLADRHRRAGRWPPGSAGTASRSLRRSAGWSPISWSTVAAPTRASRSPTSGCRGSPRTIR